MNSPLMPEWLKKSGPEKVVEWLFDQMLSKWGKQFVDKWSVVDPDKLKRDWCRALIGLTEMEFRRGVAKLNEFSYPPSQPEFIRACRPEINPLTAYYEAIEGCRRRELGEVGSWSHPAIFWASVRVSAFELKNQTYSQIRQRWEAALSAELAKDQWEEIPAPMIALPAPSKDKPNRENVAKVMEAIKGIGKSEGVDHKRWARRILEREKAGDKTLTKIQIDFAKQALNEENR